MIKKLYSTFFLCVILAISTLGLGVNLKTYADNTKTFDEFKNEAINLLQNYEVDEPCEYSISIDELDLDNGEYMIDGETLLSNSNIEISYESKTSAIISVDEFSISLDNNSSVGFLNDNNVKLLSIKASIQNTSCSIPLIDVCESLGFSVQETDSAIILTRPYQTKRLIIEASGSLDKQGAIAYVEGYDNLHIYQYASETDTLNALNYYKTLDNVINVEVDQIVTLDDLDGEDEETQNDDTINSDGYLDSFSYTTWGATSMGVDTYSEYLINTVGEDNLNEVVVAVLDTGIDTDHSWFVDRIEDGGENFSTSVSTTSYDYEDDHGHGTHVSGTICDLTLDNVKILPLKVLNEEGYGTTAGIVLAIEYAIELKDDGMNIVAMNMSFGGDSSDDEYTLMNDAITSAYNDGILSAVASGNDSANASTQTPANVSCAITVGAVAKASDETYYRPYWSNYGDCVDVSAPGYQIISASITGGTVTMSGTSMATPHVAGCIALLCSDSSNSYTVTEIETILEEYAIDLGSEGKDVFFGYGMVNLAYSYTTDITSMPTFSNTTTSCDTEFPLTISCTDTDAVIYYTLDGTIPSNTNGTLYVSAITISTTTQVKAIAYTIENSEIISSSSVNSICYIFDNIDIDNAYIVSTSGVLTNYVGVLTDLTIPSIVDGVTILSVGNYAFYGTNVENVVLPTSITSILDFAFYECSSLETITAPSVTTIGDEAFYECSSLLYVNDTYFPSVTSLGLLAFYNCPNICEISLSLIEIIPYACFYSDTENTCLTSVSLSNATIISDYAFSNCVNISSINLPLCEFLGSYVFYQSAITSADLPNLVYLGNYTFYATPLETFSAPNCLSIGIYCFEYCSNLSDVTIDSCQTIGSFAFSNCVSLVSIDLTSALEISACAFVFCHNLTSVTLTNAKFIRCEAFESCNLSSVSLPCVLIIEEYAFYENSNLSSVSLSDRVEKIALNSFDECSSSCIYSINTDTVALYFVTENGYDYIDTKSYSYLTYEIVDGSIYITGYTGDLPSVVNIPIYIESLPVVKILANAFSGCEEIITLNLTKVVEIEDYAFYNCSNLTKLEFNSIEIIGDYSFFGCSSLSNINIINVVEIGAYAFNSCDELNFVELGIYINSIGAYSLGYNAEILNSSFELCGLENSCANTYATLNSITFNFKYNELSSFYYNYYETDTSGMEIYIAYVNSASAIGNVIIPSYYGDYTISKIGDYAFADCTQLTGVRLTSTIKIIGENAFINCYNLTEINLYFVTEIGSEAFYECNSLISIVAPNLLTIPESAFYDCYQLEYASFSSITSINDSAFSYCYTLETIVCPNLISVGEKAFEYCSSLLTIDTLKLEVIGTRVGSTSIVNGRVFSNCLSLTKMYLPNVTTMGRNLFVDSGVTMVVIGKNLSVNDTSILSSDGITIYGYQNSSAITYAQQYHVNYVIINETSITTDLLESILLETSAIYDLEIEAIGYDLSYQWFLTSTGEIEDGQLISDETNISLTLDTSTAGTYYYYIKVLDWTGTYYYSNVCEVTIYDPLVNAIITASSSDNGSISNEGTTIIDLSDSKTYTFLANEHYHVLSITVDGEELEGEEFDNAILYGYTFANISSNHTISVIYTIDTYTLSVTQTGLGSATPYGILVVDYNSSQTINFEASLGYYVGSVLIDDSLIEATTSVTLNNIQANHTIDVNFLICQYTITATCNDFGTLSVPTISTVDYGADLEITFTCNDSYFVTKILVDGIEVALDNSYTFENVTQNHTIYVEFYNYFVINASTDGNGSVYPSGNVNVVYNASQPFAFIPNSNYGIYKIYVDDVLVETDDVYTFINVLDNHTIYIEFEVLFTITTSSDSNGTITTSSDVVLGNSKTINFSANAGYTISAVYIDGVDVGQVDEYTFINVDESHTVAVEYELIAYAFNITTDGNGNFTTASDLSNIHYGDSVSINITAKSGYSLDAVYVNGALTTISDNLITINNISADFNIQITFKATTLIASLTKTDIIYLSIILLILVGFTVFKLTKFNLTKR